MVRKLRTNSEVKAETKAQVLIKIPVSASKLTKGGSGHIPEYFVGIGTPVSFYA